MSRKIVRKIVIEDENPEWTLADFEKARPARELPPDILKAFPKTRGPQKLAKKVPISIRLSADVVERFKAAGPGWQARPGGGSPCQGAGEEEKGQVVQGLRRHKALAPPAILAIQDGHSIL